MINFKLSVKNSNDYLFLFEIQFKLNHPEIKFLIILHNHFSSYFYFSFVKFNILNRMNVELHENSYNIIKHLIYYFNSISTKFFLKMLFNLLFENNQ